MKLDYLRLCSRASDNPGFIWFSDVTCITSSGWVLGGSLEAGVFKLRALLGERTPKNHSAVKKDIPESESHDLEAYGEPFLESLLPCSPLLWVACLVIFPEVPSYAVTTL